MPGTVLNTVHVLTPWIVTTTLWSRYYYYLIYTWGNWGTVRLDNLSKVPQLRVEGPGFEPQLCGSRISTAPVNSSEARGSIWFVSPQPRAEGTAGFERRWADWVSTCLHKLTCMLQPLSCKTETKALQEGSDKGILIHPCLAILLHATVCPALPVVSFPACLLLLVYVSVYLLPLSVPRSFSPFPAPSSLCPLSLFLPVVLAHLKASYSYSLPWSFSRIRTCPRRLRTPVTLTL